MTDHNSKKEASLRTRRLIIDLLKKNGAMDATALSAELSLTGMAVRQHLYALQDEGIVEYEEEPRPMGRPAKLWRLTPKANALFPSGYAELTVGLLDCAREAFGEDGLEKLVALRSGKQLEEYGRQLAELSTVEEKLAVLAAIRSREGYMAELEKQADGTFHFIEKHCPICDAASACARLCQSELDLFRKVLGVEVERIAHLLSGGKRCEYKVQPDRK